MERRNNLGRRSADGTIITLQIVKTVSLETIQILRNLQHEAEQGRLIGLACCSVYTRHTFGYTVTGLALKCPELALGGVDRLSQKIHEYMNS